MHSDGGVDDRYSLWFGNSEEVADPRCYLNSDFSQSPIRACPDQRRVLLTQRIELPAQVLDSR